MRFQFASESHANGETSAAKSRIDSVRLTARVELVPFPIYFTPLGYTKILLASPVFNRSIAREKSFIGIQSVITGCRSSLPALSSAVI